MTSLIRLENISAGYDGKTIVRGVSLDVRPDTFVALIGPNGGGKTTILKVLLGQIKPNEGHIYRSADLRIGYLPQINDVDLRFPITIEDVVLSGQQSGNRLFPSKAVRRRVDELLEFAQLSDIKRSVLGELSGGQRQRVFLCRALMSGPNLLILDEPVTYMDRTAETNLYNLLQTIASQTAIVLVSHDVGTISSVVRKIACDNGTQYHHNTKKITSEILSIYEAPVEIVAHTAHYRPLFNRTR